MTCANVDYSKEDSQFSYPYRAGEDFQFGACLKDIGMIKWLQKAGMTRNDYVLRNQLVFVG